MHCSSVCQSCSVIQRRINSFDSSLLVLFLTLYGVRTWSTRPRGEPAFILVSIDRRTRPHCLQQRPLEKEVHREKGFVVVSSFEADRSPANQRSLKRIGRSECSSRCACAVSQIRGSLYAVRSFLHQRQRHLVAKFGTTHASLPIFQS